MRSFPDLISYTTGFPLSNVGAPNPTSRYNTAAKGRPRGCALSLPKRGGRQAWDRLVSGKREVLASVTMYLKTLIVRDPCCPLRFSTTVRKSRNEYL